jgi:transcription elongation factor Elf1
MSDDEWDRIVRSAKQGGHGPWTCPECDEYTVEQGQRFKHRQVIEYTLMCLSCGAEVVAPA